MFSTQTVNSFAFVDRFHHNTFTNVRSQTRFPVCEFLDLGFVEIPVVKERNPIVSWHGMVGANLFPAAPLPIRLEDIEHAETSDSFWRAVVESRPILELLRGENFPIERMPFVLAAPRLNPRIIAE